MSHSHHPVETERDTWVERDRMIERDAGAGLGMVLGLVLVVLLIGAVLWVAFAGVAANTGGARGTVPDNQGAPSDQRGGTNITVPRQIDININRNEGGDTGGGRSGE